jgi:hypothetical protein
MKPSDYKARYDNLIVPRKNGAPDTVKLNRYRLNHANYLNAKARSAFESKMYQHKINMELFIHDGKKTESLGDPALLSKNFFYWYKMAMICFTGKGAPEHCQIVLQLARHWGLAPDGLQAYADSALGLDCNGFVGNYLWHGKLDQSWRQLGLDQIEGPDTSIDGYFHHYATKYGWVSGWEDLEPSQTYILGMIGPNGRIIPGGKGPVGHIAISEPGHIQQLNVPFASMLAPNVFFQMRVIESTGSHSPEGLMDSQYCLVGNDQTKKTFKFFRKAMQQQQILDFKIVKVS